MSCTEMLVHSIVVIMENGNGSLASFKSKKWAGPGERIIGADHSGHEH